MEQENSMPIITKIFSLIVLLLTVAYFLFPDVSLILPIMLIALALLILLFGVNQIKDGGKLSGLVAIIGSIGAIGFIVVKILL